MCVVLPDAAPHSPQLSSFPLQMPFYNAVLATPYVRKFLGPYYLSSDRAMLSAMWTSLRTCNFIDDEGDVVYYKRFGDVERSHAMHKGQ